VAKRLPRRNASGRLFIRTEKSMKLCRRSPSDAIRKEDDSQIPKEKKTIIASNNKGMKKNQQES